MTDRDKRKMEDEIIATIAKYTGFLRDDIAAIYSRERSFNGVIALCEGAEQNGYKSIIDYYVKVS